MLEVLDKPVAVVISPLIPVNNLRVSILCGYSGTTMVSRIGYRGILSRLRIFSFLIISKRKRGGNHGRREVCKVSQYAFF
ncbi:hypothetical protein MKX01_037241 [Papaver californicum]|nr:hypothetical protein MKX01_037241 [Papaver californicum]